MTNEKCLEMLTVQFSYVIEGGASRFLLLKAAAPKAPPKMTIEQ
jgi:hypothetical protein